MSPSETTAEPGLLEHPTEAFAYYRTQGAPQVVCEEKHMGSRAVLVICRDPDAARKRFGVTDGSAGKIREETGSATLDEAFGKLTGVRDVGQVTADFLAALGRV
jgi:protein phosphatase